MLIVEIHAGTAATHNAVPTGAGGSVPESTGAATDDASAVAFARLASLFAVAANVAFEAISFCNSDLLFICRAQAS